MTRYGVWKFDKRDDNTWTRACLATFANRQDAIHLHITTTAGIPGDRRYGLTWAYWGPTADQGPDVDVWDVQPLDTAEYRNAQPSADLVIIRPVTASTGR